MYIIEIEKSGHLRPLVLFTGLVVLGEFLKRSRSLFQSATLRFDMTYEIQESSLPPFHVSPIVETFEGVILSHFF
jgi:hypothetical protein